jgi:hypothetical protein
MRNPTSAQAAYIYKIENALGIKFDGKTVADASKFISEHESRYRDRMTDLNVDRWEARRQIRDGSFWE